MRSSEADTDPEREIANARKCLIWVEVVPETIRRQSSSHSARSASRLEVAIRLRRYLKPSERELTLVPASPSIEAATADQKHDDNDDEKGAHIHDDVPLARRLAPHPDEVVARHDGVVSSTSSKRRAQRP
jgi:hypothetical protein